MGVGDISEVFGDAWGSGHTSSGDDGLGAGRERDTGVVGRHDVAVQDARAEPSGDRVGISHGARIEHGVCEAHRKSSGGADGLRGDSMGVGDISEVRVDAWGPGHISGGDYSPGAGRERHGGMVGRHDGSEQDVWAEPSGDRVGVSHGIRIEHWACELHREGSGGADGLRGDGMGVGDISEVSGVAWGSGHTSGGDDGRGAGRERDTGMVGRHGGAEQDAWAEPSGDRVGVSHGARIEHGAYELHREGSGGADGLRGDGMGVGDISEERGDAWGPGHTRGGDYIRGAGRERDTGMVGRHGGAEQDAWAEPSGDRVGVSHGARIEHGACKLHRKGSGGADGLRGDGLGVGDIIEVSCDAWGSGNTSSGDDGRGAGRERDTSMVGRHGGAEQDAWAEPSGDGVGVSHGARIEHGACKLHRKGWGGADGLRGDGLGVGDISEVSGGFWGSGHTSGGDDGRGAGRERHGGMVGRHGGAEQGSWAEPSGDRVGVSHGARIEHGAFEPHCDGSGGADGLRGDGLGVGDISEVSGDAWVSGHTRGGDYIRGAGRERDTGIVSRHGGAELDAWAEPSGDRVGVRHSIRIEHGACELHSQGSSGADGLRGDGLGVGDISEVSGDAWGSGHTSGGDDGRGAGRERDTGMVGRHDGSEQDSWSEPSGDRVGVSHGARIEHGAYELHREGSGGADGLRGDSMGIADFS
jgi:hypothetical protein